MDDRQAVLAEKLEKLLKEVSQAVVGCVAHFVCPGREVLYTQGNTRTMAVPAQHYTVSAVVGLDR